MMTIASVRPYVAARPYRAPLPEQVRLDAVKRAVRADIADNRAAEIVQKRQVTAVRVQAAQAMVALAKRWLAYAADPWTAWAATGAVKQAEYGLRTEYAIRAALKAGPAKAKHVAPVAPIQPVKPPSEKAGAAVWRQPGVWVANADNFPADHAIAKMKAAGVKWVALQISDGTTLNEQVQRQLNAGFIQKARAAGIEVGFWGVNRTQPEAEAAVMAVQCKKWGAGFFIANAEIEYKYTNAQGKWDAEAYGRSQRFVKAFREAMPHLPSALSSYGRADMADIDWKVWRDAGFDWLPQAYLNDFASCDPALCVDGAVKAGWPRDRVHPTVGLWGGGQSRVVPAEEYAASLRKAGTTGFSSYLAEQMSDADWAGVTQMIQAGDMAS